MPPGDRRLSNWQSRIQATWRRSKKAGCLLGSLPDRRRFGESAIGSPSFMSCPERQGFLMIFVYFMICRCVCVYPFPVGQSSQQTSPRPYSYLRGPLEYARSHFAKLAQNATQSSLFRSIAHVLFASCTRLLAAFRPCVQCLALTLQRVDVFKSKWSTTRCCKLDPKGVSPLQGHPCRIFHFKLGCVPCGFLNGAAPLPFFVSTHPFWDPSPKNKFFY